jgi:hypothetical protein
VIAVNQPNSEKHKPLHPLPRGLVELYGLLAVLIVLVPEWLAGSALASLQDPAREDQLPSTSSAWRRVPELMLASLSMLQIRQMARSQGLNGYASQCREEISSRLLKRLKRQV